MEKNWLTEFKNPGDEFRPAPFWFWNHRLEKKELLRQIKMIRPKGMRGLVLHSRHGLKIPYLSAEWMEHIGWAIKQAKKEKLLIWLYDEDNWPSGAVGGKLLQDYPQYRMQQMYLAAEFNVKGRIRKQIRVKDRILFVLAAPLKSGKPSGVPERVVDLTKEVRGGELRWSPPSGSWKVIVVCHSVHPGYFHGGYLDTLNPKAVAKFIDYTHRKYRRHFGSEFGRTVKGIFTDEPAAFYFSGNFEEIRKRELPFTGKFFAEFRKRCGYDLLPNLFGLFYNIGPETARVRCDFYQTQTELYLRAYFRQIHDYCRRAGLLLIGHPLFEGELYRAARHQGDLFRIYEYQDWAGVDLLSHQTWSPEAGRLNNLVGPKVASSGGHLFGKPRVMSESFGVARPVFWKMNLRSLKWLADWQVVLGVNYLIPHGLFYSIQGFRKWDCPPDEFYRNPYWDYYRLFADHTARLCLLFSGARHRVRTGMLYPVRSMWTAINPDATGMSRLINREFDRISELLMRLHYDFDYLSEEVIQKARVDRGRLQVLGNKRRIREEFELLILPAVTTLSRKTVSVLAEFARQGGRIIFTRFLPASSPESGEDKEVEGRIKAILKNKDTVAYLPGTVEKTKKRTQTVLNRTLRRLLKPEVEIKTGERVAREIIYTHYEKDGNDLYLFLNTSLEKSYPVTIRINNQPGTPAFLDTETGRIEELIDVWKRKGRDLQFRLDFAPVQSLVIGFGERLKTEQKRSRPLVPKRKLSLNKEWKFAPARPNAYPLSRWSYIFAFDQERRFSVVKLKIYRTKVYLETLPSRASLLVDGTFAEEAWAGATGKSCLITINGKKVKGFRGGTYIDRYIREVPVAGLLRKGENIIQVKTEGGIFEAANLESMWYLIGDFAVNRRRGKEILGSPPKRIKSGSWTEQGYPYYSGIGIYQQDVTLPGVPRWKKVTLRLEKVADLAEIIVNGRRARTRAWEPYQAEITDLVRPGRNTITIKVANTLDNLFRREPTPSGLLGKAELLIG